jgi:hypothetical protein
VRERRFQAFGPDIDQRVEVPESPSAQRKEEMPKLGSI